MSSSATARRSNPALARGFARVGASAAGAGVMTVRGTAAKAGLSLGLLVVAAAISWQHAPTALALPAVLAAFVLALIVSFKPKTAVALSLPYAVLEGAAVGVISRLYDQGRVFASAHQHTGSGVVVGAVLLTAGITAAMLALYASGTIRPPQKFRAIVMSATLGVALYYLLDIALHLFGMKAPLLWSTGPLGIAVSLVIVALAAANLVVDFDFIAGAAAQGAPRYMEWYGAFGLMVTIVWLYLELLRLLAKLQGRN